MRFLSVFQYVFYNLSFRTKIYIVMPIIVLYCVLLFPSVSCGCAGVKSPVLLFSLLRSESTFVQRCYLFCWALCYSVTTFLFVPIARTLCEMVDCTFNSSSSTGLVWDVNLDSSSSSSASQCWTADGSQLPYGIMFCIVAPVFLCLVFVAAAADVQFSRLFVVSYADGEPELDSAVPFSRFV